MAKKKRKIKFGRVLTLLLLIALIVFLVIFGLGKSSKKQNTIKKVKAISNIEEYDYTLKENATAYYKKLFKELEDTLNKKEVDEDKYLTLLSQMFVADFFNLDNKISKNDVGGVQFVYKDYRLDFEKYAMDTMYKNVQSNIYGDRKQELPIVEEVSASKVKTEAYKYGDSTDENAYIVNFDITYKDDLGYQSEGSLTVIHSDKKLEVASMSEEKVS